MAGAWRLRLVDGVTFLQCDALLAGGVAHAFSTRRGEGGDRFDLGPAGPVPARLQERRRGFLAAAGFPVGVEPVVLRQVHGARVVRVTELCGDDEADGVIWLAGDTPAPVPSVRTADCVPVLLMERSGAAAAAVHAGWRGICAGIVRHAVATLAAHGIAPAALRAALGPAIGPCCYEVGPEVIAALAGCGATGGVGLADPRPRVDLRGVVRGQLRDAGVPAAEIHVARECTACRRDLFFSHRVEGSGAGRMMASIGPGARFS
jgi:hypothetical protein